MPRTDFNGDGRDDLILQFANSGEVIGWLGQANGGFAYNQASGVDPWATGLMVGVGDMNGDGRSDTLWLTDNHELFMSHTFEEGAFFFNWSLGYVATLPINASIAAVGDFNGDRSDDILVKDGPTLSIWLSHGDSYVFDKGGEYLLPAGWDVVGTGDFNGDGRDDLLLRNAAGTITDWLGDANGGFHSNHAVAVYPFSQRLACRGNRRFQPRQSRRLAAEKRRRCHYRMAGDGERRFCEQPRDRDLRPSTGMARSGRGRL